VLAFAQSHAGGQAKHHGTVVCKRAGWQVEVCAWYHVSNFSKRPAALELSWGAKSVTD
jgi:hypothetical protein